MLPIALALAQFAPMVAGFLGGPKAADVAAHVVGLAQAVTGQATPDAALAAIQGDPQLALQFQAKVVESHVQMLQISADVDKTEIAAAQQGASDVNKTMQAEVVADHWPTYSWRPAIGFAVAIGILGGVLAVLMSYGAVMLGLAKPEVLQYLPGMLGALAALLAIPSPILGIASWFRGKMQASPDVASDNRG